MAKNKEQHYVQKAYIEQWTCQSGNIYLYDLEKRLLHEGRPSNVLKEAHLYTLKGLGEKDQLAFDDLLGEIENDGLPGIRKIINNEPLKEGERNKIALYLAAQKTRTIANMEGHEELVKATGFRNVERAIENNELLGKFMAFLENRGDPEIETIKKNPKEYFRNGLKMIETGKLIVSIENNREIWLGNIFRSMPIIANMYANADWYILRTGKKHSFVTSDNPVVTLSDSNHAEYQETIDQSEVKGIEVTFPLNPKAMLMMKLPGKKRLFQMTTKEDGESVKELNWRTSMHARRYMIGNNSNLLHSMGGNSYQAWLLFREHDRIKPSTLGKVRTINMKSIGKGLIKRMFKN